MRLRYWLGGIFLFLLFLVLQAPATLLPPLLKKIDDGRIELAVSGGTIWNGQARQLSWRRLPLWQDVQWRWNPWYLLLGKVHLTLLTGDRSAALVAGGDSVSLQAEHMQVPLRLLAELDKSLAAYQLRGMAEVQTGGFVFGQSGGRGQLAIRLSDTGSGLVAVPTLGDYRVLVSPLHRGYRFTVATERGVLRVTGDGRWEPGQGGSVRLQLHPVSQVEALRPLLSLAGRPGGNGDYYLSTSFR